MMSTKVITTFSIDGYELYGKRMVSTWIQYWPKDFELIVYTEGFTLEEKDPRITEIDINQACPSLQIFKDNSLKLIESKNKKTESRVKKAIRWAHKVYAISHALNYKCDYLMFLDGDTYTLNYVPSTIAADLVNDKLFAVHFETIQRMTHFETGLLSVNMRHFQINILRNELQKGYDNLEIHSLPKPWDGFWFAYLYEKFNLDVRNLAIKHYGVFANPLVKNILAHAAGKDKFRNSSIEYDKYSGRKKT